MRRVCALTILLVFATATAAAAQPIHGSTQLSGYASPADWPYHSSQCHWFLPAEHTHVDMQFPSYAEIATSWVINFALKLFHAAGQIGDVNAWVWGSTDGLVRPRAHDWVWDATGTSTPPVMRGDPAGLSTWTGHFTIDAPASQPHGWTGAVLSATTTFDNGDVTTDQLGEPFYATLDPSAPEVNTFADVSALCAQTSTTSPAHYGAAVVEVRDTFLPVAPIQTLWPLKTLVYGYQQVGLPDATYSEIVDLDLHHGIPGTTLMSVSPLDDTHPVHNLTLDPATLGSGSHKLALMRMQPNGTEQQATLLVTDVVVGPGVPTPPPPPPPPPPVPTPTLTCTGSVSGTSSDGGVTITIQSGTLTCGGQ